MGLPKPKEIIWRFQLVEFIYTILNKNLNFLADCHMHASYKRPAILKHVINTAGCAENKNNFNKGNYFNQAFQRRKGGIFSLPLPIKMLAFF